MSKLVSIIVPAMLLAGCAGTPPAGETRQSAAASANTGSHIAGATTSAQSTTDTSHMTNNNVYGPGAGAH